MARDFDSLDKPAQPQPTGDFAFTVELVDEGGDTVRVLCRAGTQALAAAMFAAACEEFPTERIALKKNGEAIRTGGKSSTP
ncbi:MAG: hypothetical protein ACM30I_14440 [Gemmatimonas sp.]